MEVGSLVFAVRCDYIGVPAMLFSLLVKETLYSILAFGRDSELFSSGICLSATRGAIVRDSAFANKTIIAYSILLGSNNIIKGKIA